VQRVRITSSRVKPFVRHTTPHFDGTSREVSYSVLFYHTRSGRKSKSLIPIFVCPENAGKRDKQKDISVRGWTETPNTGRFKLKFVYFDEKTLKSNANLLAFCALLLYNNANLC